MKSLFKSKWFRFIFLTAWLLAAVACEKKEESDTKVPWARPANWEGGLPGFGGAAY